MKVFLHNPSLSQFGKSVDNVLALSQKTANESLENFDRSKIEFLIFTSFAPEKYTDEFHIAAKLSDRLGFKNIFSIRTETASSSGASALHMAYYLIVSGKFKTGLVVGTEVMSRLDRSENNILLGSVLSDTQRKYSMSMAQGAALITNLYLHKFGYEKSDLYSIAKKLHDNGLNNPKAFIKKNLTKEDYLKAPIFSSPLGLYDISPLSDGSVSIIVSSEIKSEFSILGVGHGLSEFKQFNPGVSFIASKQAFHKAFLESKINPEDISVAELHDAFTIFEVIGAEDAGIFKEGTGLKMIHEGITHPTGKTPINPSGGLKSRGHPIAASGLAQIAELIYFMKQNDKRFGLAHSIGGLATNNFATIIGMS